MKSKNISLIILVLALLCIEHANAQEKGQLGVSGGIGSSSLNYPMEIGQQKSGFGGQGGVDYLHYFNENVGIRSGIGILYVTSKATISKLTNSFQAFDGEEFFEFNYELSNFEEKQSAIFLTIPIMAQYEMPVSSSIKYYVSGGGKIGIPVKSTSKLEGNTIKTSAYYPQHGIEHSENTSSGFGMFTGNILDEKLDLKASFMLSAETGVIWTIKTSASPISLYTGLYLDYGLNNIKKEVDSKNTKPFVDYSASKPKEYIFNSILNSEDNVGKIRTVGFGLLVRVSFPL